MSEERNTNFFIKKRGRRRKTICMNILEQVGNSLLKGNVEVCDIFV